MTPALAGGFFTTDLTWEAQAVLRYGQTKSTSVPVDCNWTFSTNSWTFCIPKSSQVVTMLLVGNHTLRITALKYGYLIRLRLLPFLGNKSQTNGSMIVWFPAPGPGGGDAVAGEWERVALSGERSPSITSHKWLAVSPPSPNKVFCFLSFHQEAVSLPLFNREPYSSPHVCVCSVVSDSLWPPWTVAHQAALSMEFSRQEYWCGMPFPSPGDLPNVNLGLASPPLEGGLTLFWLGHAVQVKCFWDSLPVLKSSLLLANWSTYVGLMFPTLLKAV